MHGDEVRERVRCGVGGIARSAAASPTALLMRARRSARWSALRKEPRSGSRRGRRFLILANRRTARASALRGRRSCPRHPPCRRLGALAKTRLACARCRHAARGTTSRARVSRTSCRVTRLDRRSIGGGGELEQIEDRAHDDRTVDLREHAIEHRAPLGPCDSLLELTHEREARPATSFGPRAPSADRAPPRRASALSRPQIRRRSGSLRSVSSSTSTSTLPSSSASTTSKAAKSRPCPVAAPLHPAGDLTRQRFPHATPGRTTRGPRAARRRSPR